MKKMFMMIAAVLLAASCTEKGGTETPEAKIIVAQKSINAAAEGGQYEIDYRIDGFMGGTIGANCQDDWIKVDEIGESTIFLDIAPNTTEETRTASLTVSCTGADDVYVVIIQRGKTPEHANEEMFAIEVSDVTTGTATVSIAPVGGHDRTYLYSVVDKRSYELYGAHAYIEACIEQIDALVEMSLKYDPVPRSFGDFLSRNATVNPAYSLNDDTEYYAVAFDLDVNKLYSGDITLKGFKTQKAAQSSNTFKLEMSGSRLTVTPSNNDTYICDLLTKEAWSEFATPRDVAQMFVSTMRAYLDLYIVTGAYNEDFASTLDHSGDYVAYAFGYDKDAKTGGITTEIEYIEFTYKASAASATATGQGRMPLAGGKPALRPIIMMR